jgi:hypothetical protein
MKTILTRISRAGLITLLLLETAVAHAQTDGGTGGTLGTDLATLLSYVDKYIVPLIFALAFIVFLWGVFVYFIAGGGNDEKRKEGRMFILYGIIGFVIMVSIWGIVNLITGSIKFDSKTRPELPLFGSGTQGGTQWGGGPK